MLVVEDNFDNLQLIRFLLEQAGYTVLEAHNGLEGIAAAQRENPDLILLDLSMPEKDGWSMAREVKSDPRLAAIPVVAVTAHALPGDRKKALDAGCDDYLSKPLNVSAFRETIARVINERRK